MRTWQSLGAGALAGVAAAAGHAPFGFWPVALIGFAALTYLVATRPSRGGALLVGWAGGAGYFALALSWIVEPFLVDAATHGWMAPFAVVLCALGFGLFWGLAGWLSALVSANRALSWAISLSLMELARGYILTGFPWALPAYIWADTPVRLAASVIGPYGLTLLTLLIVSLPFALTGKGRMLGGLSAALIVVAVIYSGAGTLAQDLPGTGKVVRLVQPNAAQADKWDPARAQMFVDRQIEFTAAPKDNVALIVWPETAIPYRLDSAGPVLREIAMGAEGVPVVTGINRTDETGWFNSLIVVGEDGEVDQTFDKSHLVPFGEYIPFRIEFLRAMASFSSFGFSAGDGARGLDTPLGRAWALICYEAIFPQHAMSREERPDYLLQITNDAWFGQFSGPYQHLDMARFRAVEQGLPLIRAANTGVSAVIDASGAVTASLALGEAGYLDAEMPGAGSQTIYASTGDYPVGGVLFLTLLALWWRGRRNGIAMS